jgi:hypothetical protein
VADGAGESQVDECLRVGCAAAAGAQSSLLIDKLRSRGRVARATLPALRVAPTQAVIIEAPSGETTREQGRQLSRGPGAAAIHTRSYDPCSTRVNTYMD